MTDSKHRNDCYLGTETLSASRIVAKAQSVHVSLGISASLWLLLPGQQMWGGQHPQPDITVVAVSYMEKA